MGAEFLWNVIESVSIRSIEINFFSFWLELKFDSFFETRREKILSNRKIICRGRIGQENNYIDWWRLLIHSRFTRNENSKWSLQKKKIGSDYFRNILRDIFCLQYCCLLSILWVMLVIFWTSLKRKFCYGKKKNHFNSQQTIEDSINQIWNFL